MVRDLGADHVIDHQCEPGRCRERLRHHPRHQRHRDIREVWIVSQARRPAAAGFRQSVADTSARMLARKSGGRKASGGYAPERAEDLHFLADLAAKGQFKPYHRQALCADRTGR
jgi:hypothetical protein